MAIDGTCGWSGEALQIPPLITGQKPPANAQA
jgi:hypothetical protein